MYVSAANANGFDPYKDLALSRAVRTGWGFLQPDAFITTPNKLPHSLLSGMILADVIIVIQYFIQ